MKRTISVLFIIYLSLSIILTGCGKKSPLDPNNPVPLTLWHNYGGIMQAAMDQLVEKFNDTEGKNFGIIINVESINSFTVLQEKLMAAANEDPGAPHLPDITTCYPKIAIIQAKKELLADLEIISEKIIRLCTFVEEGRIDGTLYVSPLLNLQKCYLSTGRCLTDLLQIPESALILYPPLRIAQHCKSLSGQTPLRRILKMTENHSICPILFLI